MISRRKSSMFALATLPLTATLLAGGSADAAPPRAAAEPLDILLTNDDGYSASTLAALRQALSAAGHRVTVVAPCQDQSGSGTKQSSNYPRGVPTADNTITARQPSPGVWAVCGSPGDAVLFGVQNVFTAGRPDLVVSGVNPGQNAGAVANHSGTVGATVMASELKIPAISVSVEVDPRTSPPQVGSVTGASSYVVRLIERLQQTTWGPLLPEHVTLNVNYPVASTVQGTRVTSTGRVAFVRPKFVPTSLCPDCYVVSPQFDFGTDPVSGSDNGALAADYIAVTPLDGDWTASSTVRSDLRQRLTGLG